MRGNLPQIVLSFALLLPFLSRVAAGQEESKTKLDLKVLTGLLGKDRNSAELERFRKLLNERPEEANYDSYKVFFYIWRSKGLSLRFNSGKLTGIHMYAGEADDYKRYEGELPAKLSFADTRADVEEKLGTPEVSGGGGVIPFWVAYKSRGISVDYVGKDPNNQKNRIRSVGLMVVSEKGK